MKTVLITGGSRGIGASCVREYIKNGYNAVFTYKSMHSAAQALSLETGATAICADTSDSAAVIKAVSDAAVVLGSHIDTLVCCAGISRKALLSETADDDWNTLIGVNLSGSFYTARAVIPYMVRQKSGSIIFISSMWGLVGASCEAAYSASKAGLHGLTKALAKELGPSSIRVNCIAPGVIDTDMNTDLSLADRTSLCDETPLCRLGTSAEVAQTVQFLSSDNASFITGQIISVNGGIVI